MNRIKKGDIVGRLSYGKDILFTVERILKQPDGKQIVILKGITVRVEADAPIEDLEIVEKHIIEKSLRSLDNKLEEKIKKYENKIKFSFNFFKNQKDKRSIEITHTGTILHLDGDTHLSNLKKCSNINTYKQVIFNHDLNNVSNY